MSFDYKKLCEDNLYKYGHDTNHLELLGKLYADDTHFIYELLQNAEDAKAKSVMFQLWNDRLEILHDGRIFTEQDVNSITQIAESTKTTEDGFTKIGKFGLGFKSVYVITDTPQIHSGDFHFHIEQYIRPSEIPVQKIDERWTTMFILQFKLESMQNIYKSISKKLQDLKVRTLLFLTHIKNIKYKINNETEGEYLRDNETNENGLKQIVVISSKNESETLFVFNKQIDNKKIEIAFQYDNNKILSAKDTKLIVYFPTAKETNLGFLINGNFRTTPARDNVPEDDEYNIFLINMAADLLAEAIQKIKSARLCNISFLESLPIIADNFPKDGMFYPLFEKTKNILMSNDYLPTSTNGFISAEKAIIARSSDLIELYKPDGKIWLSKNITQDNYPNLFSYLKDILSIQIITSEYFAEWINKDFLDKQTDDWFIKFYIFLRGLGALWREKTLYQKEGVLRSKPILRIENGTLKTPKEEVFLPMENIHKNYCMIKKSITLNEEALKFLKELGLEIPKPVDDIIQTVFPKYETTPSVSDNEYKNDLESILYIMKDKSQDAKEKLNKKLQNLLIIKCNDGCFRKPSDVYCNTDELKEWFQYSENIYFVDDTLDNDDWKLLSVEHLPRRILLDTLPNGTIKQNYTRYNEIKNYDLDGLNDFINNMTPNNAKVIMEIIISEYQICKGFFIGSQRYFYQREQISTFYNNIYQKLDNSSWILGKDNNLYKPKEIAEEDITDGIDIISLRNLSFKFKKGEDKKIEEYLVKQGKEIISSSELEELRKKAAMYDSIQKQNEESQNHDKDNWKPECSIEDMIITEGASAPIPETEGIGSSRKINPSIIRNQSEVKTKTYSPEIIKQIGELGEDIVKKYLMETEEYEEEDIYILNSDENIGTGRDFEIRKNGEIVKIIEVKSTEEISASHKFNVSGKQWETGRHEQDKYWIYAVFGVGSKNPEVVPIKNPIKQWKDGNIQADPVNFIVRRNV